jgi:type I site-specific restriction endonuclease
MSLTPEQKARLQIEARLVEAGWTIQDVTALNLTAGRGIAVREFPLLKGHGTVDYLLYGDRKALGVVEAKKEGEPLPHSHGRTVRVVLADAAGAWSAGLVVEVLLGW